MVAVVVKRTHSSTYISNNILLRRKCELLPNRFINGCMCVCVCNVWYNSIPSDYAKGFFLFILIEISFVITRI